MGAAPSGRGTPAEHVDAVVVGAGLAGMTAALELLRAAPGTRVVLVTKTALGDGSTRWAQGGIAAVVPGALPGEPLDDVALHVADTLAAGAGLCVPDAVRVLCARGSDAVAALQGRGVAFDRLGTDGPLQRGLEAAHGRRRVLHAGGDVTGARIAEALVLAVRDAAATGALRVVEGAALADLVVEAGRVVGVRLVGADGTGPAELRAPAVVLATGGAGQLFAHTTNPEVATGDGLAAAARAGAVLVDLEMYQFHPTLAALAGEHGRFLVSEAVRGEGAVLRDERGRRFLADGPLAHPLAELAPRDVVARAIAAAMAEQGGRPVLLDATAVAAATGTPLAERFPGIDALCRAAGHDWARDPVPVTPAAHYWMGGVRTGADGRTDLPGLWAVGEVAWTGVHGANRLASNSLLEAAVFATRAAADVVAGGRRGSGDTRDTWGPQEPAGADGVDGTGTGTATATGTAAVAAEAMVDVVELPSGVLPRAELQGLLWHHAGVVRDGAGLEVAAKELAAAPPAARPAAPPGDTGAGGAAAVRAHEDAALTTAATLLVAAARLRRESRGAHHRSDHPHQHDPARHTVLRGAPRP